MQFRAHGFLATIAETSEMQAVNARAGVPKELPPAIQQKSPVMLVKVMCPLTLFSVYLLNGLAVPGIGSPGMEGGTPEAYERIQFGRKCLQ